MVLKDINLMSLDLEMNQPSGKIIQIGYCVNNLVSGELKHSSSIIINPDEQLTNFIINLTGITQEEADSGRTLTSGYAELIEIHQSFGCFRNPLVWGGGDSDCLRKQLGIEDTDKFLFGRRWLDVKTVFIARCMSESKNFRCGLGKAIQRLGMKFEGRKHNAKDDALNTFRVYRHLLTEFKPVTLGDVIK